MADQNDDFEKQRLQNQQILAGLAAKEQDIQDATNPQRPLRAAALAALSGENPLTAAQTAIQNRTNVTPEQIAHKLFERAEEAGMPLRAPGQEEFPLEKPAGAVIGQLTDPGTLQGLAGGAVAGTLSPQARYKNIASALKGGKTVAAELPKGQIVKQLRKAQAEAPETIQQPESRLQEKNIPISGEEYKEKIARLRMDKNLREAKEILHGKPQSWFDLARKVRSY